MKAICWITLFVSFSFIVNAQGGKPNVEVTLQPEEKGNAVYEVVAAANSTKENTAQIALLLDIKNNTRITLKFTKIIILYKLNGSFEEGLSRTFSNAQTILANANIYWNNERGTCIANDAQGNCTQYYDNVLYIPKSNPTELKIKLFFDGYSDPVEITRTLKPHQSQQAANGYLFPAKAKDLRVNEYWTTSSNHGTSSYGSQLFAYDITCIGWNGEDGWQGYIDNTIKRTRNDNFRIYNKPLYALADGMVCRFNDGEEANPDPPTYASNRFQKGLTTAGGGNSISIISGDEIIQYAHMIKNTMPVGLKHIGAKVKAGDFLGRVGNTGNSSEPHVHIDVMKIRSLDICTGDLNNNHPGKVALRPFHFRDSYVIAKDDYAAPDPKDDWVELKGAAIPAKQAMIWPNGKPCYFPPDRTEIAFHGIPFESSDEEFNKIAGCGYYPVWIDGFQVNGKNYFNMIFRPFKAGLSCYTKTKLTPKEYKDEIEKNSQQKNPMQLTHVESYEYNGERRYAFIMISTPGPATVAYHGLSYDEHKKLLNELAGKGYTPVNLAVTCISAIKEYTGLYKKINAGLNLLKSNLTQSEYQALFEDRLAKKWEQVYINTYKENNETKFSVIWHEKGPYTGIVAVRKASGEGYQIDYNKNTGAGLLTRCVTGYDVNGVAYFAAHWSK